MESNERNISSDRPGGGLRCGLEPAAASSELKLWVIGLLAILILLVYVVSGGEALADGDDDFLNVNSAEESGAFGTMSRGVNGVTENNAGNSNSNYDDNLGFGNQNAANENNLKEGTFSNSENGIDERSSGSLRKSGTASKKKSSLSTTTINRRSEKKPLSKSNNFTVSEGLQQADNSLADRDQEEQSDAASVVSGSESNLGISNDAALSEALSSPAGELLDNYRIKVTKVGEPNEFSGVPPIPGSLRIMADGEAPEVYFVESGDTLFDICSQLLDEGGYWPKLWSMNPQIKNPHFVWPGMQLSFYPGDDETPPFLEIMAEDDLVPIDKGGLDEDILLHGNVPVFDRHVTFVSTPVIGASEVDEYVDDNRVIDAGRIFDPSSVKVTVPGFIYEEEKDPLGVVLGGLEGEAMLGQNKKVIIEIEEAMSADGSYTILRQVAEVETLETGETVGYHYEFVANVKVEYLISEPGIAIGNIFMSRLGVQEGDEVFQFISTVRTTPMGRGIGRVSTSDASIVAFGDSGRTAGAEGSLLFIDRGSSAGVGVGQFYQIFSDPSYLVKSRAVDSLEGIQLPVGYIRIVDITPVAALGIVVKARKEVRLGDYLRKG